MNAQFQGQPVACESVGPSDRQRSNRVVDGACWRGLRWRMRAVVDGAAGDHLHRAPVIEAKPALSGRAPARRAANQHGRGLRETWCKTRPCGRCRARAPRAGRPRTAHGLAPAVFSIGRAIRSLLPHTACTRSTDRRTGAAPQESGPTASRSRPVAPAGFRRRRCGRIDVIIARARRRGWHWQSSTRGNGSWPRR